MLRFALRRLLLLVPTLFGLSVALFAWVRALPGGPAAALLGERATPETIAAVNRAYGLDRPLHEQYWLFLRKAVVLDFGDSISTGRPVTEEMLAKFPATIELALLALVLAVAVGVPVGYLAARRHGTWLDHVAISGSLVGISVPVFFLGYLLKIVFAENLGWFPTQGRQDTRGFLDAEYPTGFYVLDGLLTGYPEASWDALLHLVLPAVALSTIPLAIIARITRAAVLDVLHEDYVRTAEAKGLTKRVINRRHVLRNALLPVSTVIGIQLGLLLSGALLTETVFEIQGVGRFLVEAVRSRDYPVVQGFVLVIAVIYTVVNLLVDMAYGLIDPRVRVR